MNYILAYYQAIKDGTETVGKKIRLTYEMIIHGLEKKEFFYDHKKAAAAIIFMENYVHHHEGVLAPGLVKLELWQKAALSCIYGIVDENGLRQFREIFWVTGRKNGKTLIASGVAEKAMFFDGEYGARIYFAAPKLEQATLCYSAFYNSIGHEPELAEMSKKRRTDIYVESTNSSAKPLAFSEKKSDGLNVSCAVCDEVASWQGDQGLKFYEVLRSSFGSRRQPLMFCITTAGYINEGIYDELYKRSTRVLLGEAKEKRLLPFIYEIDDIRKWNDINELKKANPNLGVSVSVDYLLGEIDIAEESLSKRAEFLTKYCNVKQSSSLAWLPETAVLNAGGEHMELSQFCDSYAVAGIDLSRTTDLTAATVVIEKDGILNVFAHFWLPGEKITEAAARDGLPYQIYVQRGLLSPSGDNVIDYQDVYRWMTTLIEEYRIYPLMVGYDRYSAQYLIQDLKGYGFQTDDVFQGTNLTPVIRETEGLLRDGRIRIGDNDLLKVHLLDSALKVDAESERCKLIKLRKNGHIDGTAALLCAMCVRQKHWQMIGDQLRNEG
jgi:phage terminase large subunit-like protein